LSEGRASLAVFREANLGNLSILMHRDWFYHSAFVVQKPNRTLLSENINVDPI